MRMLSVFLISCLPFAVIAGFNAITLEVPAPAPAPTSYFYQAGAAVDGKIDRIDLTFSATVQSAFPVDFEVAGYQISSVAISGGGSTVSLYLVNGDVQDTGATPLVKFFPGHLTFSDFSVVDSSQLVETAIAADGAAPVLDILNGQALFRPVLGLDSLASNSQTTPGSIFMSFSERVNVQSSTSLTLGILSDYCDLAITSFTPVDGSNLSSTAHITMPSLCSSISSVTDYMGLESDYMDTFVSTIVDASNLALTYRSPPAGSSTALWEFFSPYDGSSWSSGVTFDDATTIGLLTNSTVCNRSSVFPPTPRPVFFSCNGTAPARVKVIASSWDTDSNGKIDTIQVRTMQDRMDYFPKYGIYGRGSGNATHTIIKNLTLRSTLRQDTWVPSSNLNSWSLPGYNIINASYERGRILLRVTELSAVDSSALTVNLSYAGSLTTWTGNILDASLVSIDDRACPVIVSVKASGGSPAVYVQFSEAVKNVLTSSFTAATGKLGSTTFISTPFPAGSVTSIGNNTYVLLASTSFNYLNFGSNPVNPYRLSALSSIDQLTGPSCPLRRSYFLLTALDTTPPGVLFVYTRDNNGNGKIDGFTIVFNKTITIATLNVSQFSAVGFSGLTALTNVDSATVEFSVTEATTINTVLTTQFIATAPTLVDQNNNPLAAFNVTTTDGVGAVPLSVSTGNAYPAASPTPSYWFDRIIIQFSEAVNCSLINSTNFTVSAPQPPGATALIGPILNTLCVNSTVTLMFTPIKGYAASTPLVTYMKGSGKDTMNNLIPNWSMNAADGISPVCGVLAATPGVTADRNNNGKVDTIILDCTEQLKNVGQTSFTLDTYTILNATPGNSSSNTCASGQYAFCVVINVQEKASFDTDAEPNLSYLASSLVTDITGNPLYLLTSPVAIGDAIPPYLASIKTKDLNADGKIDAFQLQFSEALLVINVNDFGIANYTISSYAVSNSNSLLTLYASANSSVYDGGATPYVVYTQRGNVQDANYNSLLTFNQQSLDGVFPIVLNAFTAGDCKLGSVQISMNENINLTSVNTSSFKISGYTIVNATLGGVSPFGFSLNVVPYSRLVPDIVMPTVTYASPLTIYDNNNNPMTAFNMNTTDHLPPCMVACFSHVGSASIAIQFSEPVGSGATATPLVMSNFALNTSSTALFNFSAVNTTFYYLAVNQTFIESDINYVANDTNAFLTPVNVSDLNKQIATARCYITNDDFTPPSLINAKTVNTNNSDLQIDRILLTFDESISDASLNISDWTVAGYTINSTSTGSVANDNRIYLVLNILSVPDTDATPVVTYTRPAAGGFTDRNRNFMSSNSTVALDNAAPILATFQAIILSHANGDNIALATFSEPVYGPGFLTSSNFIYVSTNGNAASIVNFTDADGRHKTVVMKLNALALSDFNSDTVTPNVTDAAGNPSYNASVFVTKGDVKPPVLISALTGDTNVDGQIDHLTVTFNESMLVSSLNASNFVLDSYNLTGMLVNDYIVEFNISQLTVLDGAVRPTFNYTAGNASDLNGNFLISFSNQTSDGVAPFLLDCSSTLPFLHTIDCVFSETVNGTTTDFVLGGPLSNANIASVVVNGANITLVINRNITLTDFKTNGTINLGATNNLVDANNNVGRVKQVGLRNTDTTPPLIVNASTKDRDCNGHIDAIEVIFNEGVIDTNINVVNFAIAGYTITGKDTGLQMDDSSFFLNVTEGTTVDTDASGFNLTYTAGTLTDLSENAAVSFTATVLDGAGVALVSVTGVVDTPFVNLNFSSPFSANNAVSDLILMNFSFPGGSFVDGNGQDSFIRLMLTGNLKPKDFTTPAMIFPKVLDAQLNYACPKAVALTNPDKSVPTILSVATSDSDSDGRIDGFVFNCSKPIDEQSLLFTDFSVTNYTVTAVHGISPPSSMFLVVVAEKNYTDASERPVVSYTSGSATDRYGNKLVAVNNFASVDRIGPSIIRATGSGSSLTLIFSKPIVNSTNGTKFTLDDVVYNSTSASPKYIVTVIDGDGSDLSLTYGLSRAFVDADFGAEFVAGKSTIRDVNGNQLNAAYQAPVTRPVAVPGPGAAASTGLSDTAIIGIGAGVGGAVVLLIAVAVGVVLYKKGYCCKKKDSGFDQDQIANEFDFGSTQTEMAAQAGSTKLASLDV